MSVDNGASVPDQALVQAPSPDGLGPTGFDPSRVVADLSRQIARMRRADGKNLVAPIIEAALECVLAAMLKGVIPAQTIETRSAKTEGLGPKDASPVGSADAPKASPDPRDDGEK